MPVTARPATADDIDEMVRLAAVMYAAMGQDADDPTWRTRAPEDLRDRLGIDVVGQVVDAPEGGLGASGVGVLQQRMPGPTNLEGRIAYVQWVATDPRCRRRGYARAVLSGLLDTLAERGAGMIELHATPEGAPLYSDLGFVVGDFPGVRLRTADWRA